MDRKGIDCNRIAFSLLHYNNTEVTCEAVEYLRKLNGIKSAEIVIVDNASPNGSGMLLKKKYENDRGVHVLLNEKNGGFAYGNNVGYKYAREVLNCDTIVVMNNDVYIKDIGFIEKLHQKLMETTAEIIAPSIIGRQGNQNPFRTKLLSNKRALVMLVYNALISVVYLMPMLNVCVARYLDKKEKISFVSVHRPETEFIVPHGACIIYTHRWIDKEDRAFMPDTFMYMEEDVLSEYLVENGYSVDYIDELVVNHVEDATVEHVNKASYQKRRFIANNMAKSLIVLLKMRMSRKMRR